MKKVSKIIYNWIRKLRLTAEGVGETAKQGRSMANVTILPDAQRLALEGAQRFIQIASQAIEAQGSFAVSLAGGTTPVQMYGVLASEPYSEEIDWSRVFFFWGDERCVPPDHPDSNYRRAKTTLLDLVPVPPENVHRIQGELPPEQAAEAYEEALLAFFSSLPGEEERRQAGFDLALLGMGDDGHTASLFPGAPAIHEDTRWVKAQYVDRVAAWRITLTPAILNRARQVIFLVSGQAKSYTLPRVIYGSYQPERYPAQVIRPQNGEPVWLIDEAAAALF
jgi:6-phosphogluconolactonase